MVGLISHVEALKERIPLQIKIRGDECFGFELEGNSYVYKSIKSFQW